jgi:hypothetical protein
MRKFASATALAVMALSGAFTLAPAASASPSKAARPQAPDNHLARRPAQGTKASAHVQPGGPVAIVANGASFGHAQYGIQSVASNNWGGYAAVRQGTKFRYIQATFFVPYVNCSATPSSFSGHWVGLDGLASPTVEQDGILAACNGTTPEYSAWYERFPLAPVYKDVNLHPGDSVTASVYYDQGKNNYKLSLTDMTSGEGFSVSKSCPKGSVCERASAEAISEAPADGSTILPLTDFGAESYGGVKVTDRAGQRGGLTAANWDTESITTVNGDSDVLDQPTHLDHGSAFAMYWMAEG